MISFAIPTWNRSDTLEACVESIASQNPAEIIIADDASTDDTPAVCARLVEKYPFIKYKRFENRLKFAGNFKRAVECATSEYTWTFGDDDKLFPGAVQFIDGLIQTRECDFYHVAETTRVQKQAALCDSVLGLCNTVGFLDFTGFISGNIAKTDLYKQAVCSVNWELFSTSSYPQSLGILEAMHDRSAMMVEMPCVESSKSNDRTAKVWEEEQICWKYLYIGNGLKKLQEEKKLPEKVHETFFRYLEENMFTRMMRDFNGRAVLAPEMLKPSDWECFLHMAKMVDGERGKILHDWIYEVMVICETYKPEFMQSARAYEKMKKATESIKLPNYPLYYLP